MNRPALTLILAWALLLVGPQSNAQLGTVNGHDYNNGVYVKSSLIANSDGTITASCRTDVIDPSNGNTTATKGLYQLFSTTCAVTPDPGGLAATAQNASCNSVDIYNNQFLNQGSGDAGPVTGDCNFTFQATPGTTYTLNSQHFIWMGSVVASNTGGPCGVQLPSPIYFDSQFFSGIPAAGTTFSSLGPTETYDIFNSANSSSQHCLTSTQVANSAGAYQIATTQAQFAAIFIDPSEASFYQTQEYGFSSNLSTLQSFWSQQFPGIVDSLTWCVETSTTNCATSPSGIVNSSLQLGSQLLSQAPPPPQDTATIFEPSQIQGPSGDGFATEYLCVQENLQPYNFACAELALNQIGMFILPTTLPVKPITLTPTAQGKKTLTAYVYAASEEEPASLLNLQSNLTWTGWNSTVPPSSCAQNSITTLTPSRASNTYDYCAPSGNDGYGTLTDTAQISMPSASGESVNLSATAYITVITNLQKQTINFDAIPPQTEPATLTLAASASSGLPINYYSTTPQICTVTGNTVTLIGTGVASVTAEQLGNSTFADASATQSFTVTSAGQAMPIPAPGTIATVAGNGTQGYLGDGGLATSAELNTPWGVAVDSAGNIYFADTENNVIRKVTASTDTVSTVAGNGTQGYSGDGGSATAAELNSPAGLAVDAAGNIYIADRSNNLVREVSASTGNIATVAGIPNNPWGGYWGDGGPATSAALTDPTGVSVDPGGNIYIADMFNSVIRKVVASTGIITTVAGNGNGGYTGDGGPATSAQLWLPTDVQEDASGNLYIADYYNHVIREVSASTGTIATVAGNGTAGYSGDGGPATSATLGGPVNLALDSAGNIYTTDSGNNVIRVVSASTGTINTMAGDYTPGYSGDGGPALGASLNYPTGVATPPAGSYISTGGIFFADSDNNVIRAVGGYRVASPTFSPVSATYSAAQTVTISDSLSGATIYYTTDGTTPTTSSTVYSGPISASSTETLNAIAVNSAGQTSGIGTAPYSITQTTPVINFASGFTSSGLSLVNAPIVNGGLQLSDGNQLEQRAAWYTTPVSAQAFTSDFNYQATSAIADGIAFVLQNSEDGLSAIGDDGEGLGYEEIDSSVAIKLDLYNNYGEGTDSTGFYTNGASPTIPALDMTSSGVILRSGDLMHVHINYDGTTLTWTVSDTVTNATFTSSTVVNIPSVVGGNTAYVGITGSTGAFGSSQSVTSWTLF